MSFSSENLEKLLLDGGISNKSVKKIIDCYTFNSSSKDLIDAPLIENEDECFVLPSIVKLADPASALFSSFISKRFDVSFKGEGFEKRIKSLLSKNNINNTSLYQKVNNDEYECDVVANLDSTLIFIECKSIVQPNDITEYYDFQYKINDAINQLNRIVKHYEMYLDFVKQKLGLEKTWQCENIVKIIITTAMIGETIFDKDTFVIDDSAMSRFLNREPYGIRVGKKL